MQDYLQFPSSHSCPLQLLTTEKAYDFEAYDINEEASGSSMFDRQPAAVATM
jgi:hypothetical protein